MGVNVRMEWVTDSLISLVHSKEWCICCVNTQETIAGVFNNLKSIGTHCRTEFFHLCGSGRFACECVELFPCFATEVLLSKAVVSMFRAESALLLCKMHGNLKSERHWSVSGLHFQAVMLQEDGAHPQTCAGDCLPARLWEKEINSSQNTSCSEADEKVLFCFIHHWNGRKGKKKERGCFTTSTATSLNCRGKRCGSATTSEHWCGGITFVTAVIFLWWGRTGAVSLLSKASASSCAPMQGDEVRTVHEVHHHHNKAELFLIYF